MLTLRTAIINHYLKSEVYDETVSVAKLAACTSLFSGSDLRYLVHAAALAALKDITPTSWQIQYGADGVPIPESSRTPLESRVIRGRHFDQARKQVSASSATNRKELDELRRWEKELGFDQARKQVSASHATNLKELDELRHWQKESFQALRENLCCGTHLVYLFLPNTLRTTDIFRLTF
jgi:hypothetical protein